jgi:cysteine desulfurase/selenocysteine lyase
MDQARFDVEQIRGSFPVLLREINGRDLVYLDSATTSLKAEPAIRAQAEFYTRSAGGVHRSIHALAVEASEAYAAARQKVARFIGAEVDEVVFVRNSTEAINLVATALPGLERGRVVATAANHHSGLLPWLNRGRMDTARVAPDGTLDLPHLESLVTEETALLCVSQVSNAMGLQMPVGNAIRLARDVGALVLVDGAQSVPHMPVDVRELDCDFLVFSGHKMLAPFGIGVLYAKREHLEAMRPYMLGGDMVSSVTSSSYELASPPARFEAGTPNVGGAVALAAAVDFLEEVGLDRIEGHVRSLARLARSRLREIDGVRVHGPEEDTAVCSAVNFGVDGMAAETLSRLLSSRFGVMTRSGHHCAQPYHEALGLPATVRASFYLYNTEGEVDLLARALQRLLGALAH